MLILGHSFCALSAWGICLVVGGWCSQNQHPTDSYSPPVFAPSQPAVICLKVHTSSLAYPLFLRLLSLGYLLCGGRLLGLGHGGRHAELRGHIGQLHHVDGHRQGWLGLIAAGEQAGDGWLLNVVALPTQVGHPLAELSGHLLVQYQWIRKQMKILILNVILKEEQDWPNLPKTGCKMQNCKPVCQFLKIS